MSKLDTGSSNWTHEDIKGKVKLTWQLKYIVKEIPVQAGEMPLLLWLSFQNILPVPDIKRSTLMNENSKTKIILYTQFKQNKNV
jgi:hypothetical protein